MAKITKEAALLYHSQSKPGKILEVPGTGQRAEWLEPVDDAAYASATN